MNAKKELAALLILTIAIGAVSTLYHLPTGGLPRTLSYTDIGAIFVETQHGLPYIQARIEYPVLVGLFMYLCAVIGGGPNGYYIVNSVLLTACAVVTVFFLYRVVEDSRHRSRIIPFLIVIPTLFFFMIYNWDMISVMFTVIGFYFIKKDRYGYASFFFALGFCTKFYPVLFLLPMLIKRRDRALRVVAVFVVTSLAINLPFMLLNYPNWSYFWTLNSARAPNVDSIWFLIGSQLLPGLRSVKLINYLSLALFGVSALLVVALRRRETVIKQFYYLTILFLLFNKVFSPQYLLWLVPFFVMFPRKVTLKSLSLQASNIAVMSCVLLYYFAAVTAAQHAQYIYAAWILVVVREALLVWLLVHLLGERAIDPRQAKARRMRHGHGAIDRFMARLPG